MRKLAVALALASTALATPALARDKTWYVGAEGGAMIVEDIHFDVGTTSRATTLDHNYGYDVDGQIGYDFGMFRVEAEVGYRSAKVQSLNSVVRTPSGSTTVAPGQYPFASGRSSALDFMLNGLLDFGGDDELQGFVGGGVGAARIKERARIAAVDFLNDSDTVFAYQGLAGIRAPITKNIDVSLKYRFFNAENPHFVDTTNRSLSGRYRSHSITGGITYNFYTPPPPPPPVQAPPPEAPAPVVTPPPPAPVCQPGPFIVFFEWNKSDVTPEAASILDNAVTQYATCGNAAVSLAGYTDTSGTPKYNIGLSQRRADSVKAYLTAHSIPDGVITTSAFGEDPSKLRVQTADGVREVQNRRVEIMYGPGSGQ